MRRLGSNLRLFLIIDWGQFVHNNIDILWRTLYFLFLFSRKIHTFEVLLLILFTLNINFWLFFLCSLTRLGFGFLLIFRLTLIHFVILLNGLFDKLLLAFFLCFFLVLSNQVLLTLGLFVMHINTLFLSFLFRFLCLDLFSNRLFFLLFTCIFHVYIDLFNLAIAFLLHFDLLIVEFALCIVLLRGLLNILFALLFAIIFLNDFFHRKRGLFDVLLFTRYTLVLGSFSLNLLLHFNHLLVLLALLLLLVQGCIKSDLLLIVLVSILSLGSLLSNFLHWFLDIAFTLVILLLHVFFFVFLLSLSFSDCVSFFLLLLQKSGGFFLSLLLGSLAGCSFS